MPLPPTTLPAAPGSSPARSASRVLQGLATEPGVPDRPRTFELFPNTPTELHVSTPSLESFLRSLLAIAESRLRAISSPAGLHLSLQGAPGHEDALLCCTIEAVPVPSPARFAPQPLAPSPSPSPSAESLRVQAARFGGALRIDDDTARPLRCTLYLPVAPTEELAHAAAQLSTTDSAGPLQGFRILLAEANIPCRRFVQRHFTSIGAQVDTADHGVRVLELVDAHPDPECSYDLLLLDLQMPLLDGVETLLAVRQRGVECPVAALTGWAEPGSQESLLDLGFDASFPKPIDLKDLDRGCLDLIASSVRRSDRPAA